MNDRQRAALVDAEDAARRMGAFAGKLAQELDKAADAFRRLSDAWDLDQPREAADEE